MTPTEQARRYVEAIPGAVSGQSGHDQTFGVACAHVHGFMLADGDAWHILCDYNCRCQPAWSERELLHKLESAKHARHEKPAGHLLSASARRNTTASKPMPFVPPQLLPAAPQQPATPTIKYDITDAPEMLPEPLPDQTRTLIRECFKAGEGIRIAPAELGDDGKERPEGGGCSLSREEWLARLDKAKGNPNGIWTQSDGAGIYIAINPYKIGATTDSEVVDFRHVLVEFDAELSPEEQFRLYTVSQIPCAAIIYSGRRSVHAWIRVDAKDRQEYDARCKVIYDHFSAGGFKLDGKNKNPGRLSRLPGCHRFDGRQELLAINTGKESFSEWLIHLDGESLGESKRFTDYLKIDTTRDENCVIGFRPDGTTTRYLCKGKGAWLIGPSGIGKSTLTTELVIGWALGKPVFGLSPGKPRKILIVQAENDDCDIAEMLQGVVKSHDFKWDELQQLDENVIFRTETRCTGADFIKRLHRLIDKYRPDIVFIDPLLSFAGINVANQVECTHFLRDLLNPLLEATGVVMIGIHHTGKPKDAKSTQGWTDTDFAYAGIGSSELVNWARAVLLIRPCAEDGKFELKLCKRGSRANAKHPDGSPATKSIWLAHGRGIVRWEQIAPPEEGENASEGHSSAKSEATIKRTQTQRVAGSNLHDVLAKIPSSGMNANKLGKLLQAKSRQLGCTIGETTARTTLLDLLVGSQKLTCDAEGLYFRGPNA